ncbi:MAG: ATP-binding protein [Casimicrobiaceae bacterium]
MPDSIFTPDERPAAVAARLALALEASNLGDWTWEAATDLVRLSPRGAEIFGLAAGVPIAWKTMRPCLHPEDRERAHDAVERAIAERSDYDMEYRIVLTGDVVRWVHARGRAIHQGDVLRGMLGVVADVTTQKSAEAAVRERGAILKVMHDVGLLIAGELDQDKLIQAVTDAGTQMTRAEFGAFFYNVVSEQGGAYMLYTLSGVSRQHFANFPMPRATPLFGPTFEGKGTIRLDDVMADTRYGRAEPYHGMPPGHLPVRSYLAVPVVGRSGGVLGGLFFGHSKVGVFTEVAERAIEGLAAYAAVALENARLLDRTRQAIAEAENANRLKDEFLATLSHELRTPLNAVLGWTHLLRTGRLTEDLQARAIETIERNAKVQGQIIEDILDVSRIITGKLRLDLGTVELAAVLEAAVNSMRPSADAKQIEITCIVDAATAVAGDAARLQQVMWNLLSNAVKFTPKQGRVQVTLACVESNAVLRVTDTGEGIDPAVLPHVFDRFRQEDSSTTRAHGGLGLGLAIVRHLVELHGGSVHAESGGKGQGSTFSVRIPVSAARVEGEDDASVASPAAAATRTFAGSGLRGARILAVDDDAASRELLVAILGGNGAQVDTAESAASALGRLAANRYDVLISDLGMPDEDGYALISRLRGWPPERGGRTPAVALTAYARSEDRIRCLTSGFQNHLAKPVDPPELLATVAALLGRLGQSDGPP